MQSIYEGDVRFEHCYRLDLEVDTAPTHRQACWKEWLGRYTYGQPRDRVEYARRRVHAFAAGDTARPRLDVATQTAPAEPQAGVSPGPTSAHAPPPAVAPIATPIPADAGAAPELATPTPPPTPKEKCSKGCLNVYEDCLGPCTPDAGQADPRCKSCAPDYTACMKRCFQ